MKETVGVFFSEHSVGYS